MKFKNIFKMHLFTSLTYLTSTNFFVGATTSSLGDYCKCMPSEPCWPDSREWSGLNKTLNGALLKTVPPGIVCYPGPQYDEEACEKVTQASQQHSWIANSPYNVMQPGWNGNPCPPTNRTVNGTCDSLLGSPVYVINATLPKHVEAGVKFAKRHNIRLIIKNTGHEFLGRSSGAHSLSIWTHHMRDVEFTESFQPKKCSKFKAHSAVTVGAGMQWRDLMSRVDKYGKLVVTGGNPTVGCIGGFLQGGGHSPISSKYGLAVDQVMEFKLVTPCGKYITANECENPEYFWALRGGGGGTFGVVTSATFKTYPTQPIHIALQTFNQTSNNTDAFWDFMGYVFSEIPRINDNGLMGYTFIYGDSSTNLISWTAIWFSVGGSQAKNNETLAPMYANISAHWKDDIVGGHESFTFRSYTSFFMSIFKEEMVGSTAVLPSRLLDKRALTEDPKFLASTLKKMWSPFVGAYLNHIVAGPGVAQYKDVDMALNPAWRKTYTHFIAASGWDNLAIKDAVLKHANEVLDYNLKKLAPQSGQYLNEALYGEDGWQQANWGANYPRLFSFKNEVDPDGVLYCFNCVGSEKWVQGKDGSLCRAKWA